jgi:hypothetical protein
MFTWKWKVYVNTLDRVFGGVSKEEKELNAHMMRVSVLHEDLRIENLALAEPSLPGLDTIGVDYRRMYFIRRSIATVREFAEALPALDSCAGFHSIKNRLNETERAMWDKSVRFFRRNYLYIQKIRNDFGGHFGYGPAWHAVKNLQETVAVLEYKHSSVGRRIQIRLKFAGEVVAIGMGHHKRGDTSKDHFRLMFRLALAAFAHSTRCVELLTLIYFEPRIRNVR